jgi:hypothetical protein
VRHYTCDSWFDTADAADNYDSTRRGGHDVCANTVVVRRAADDQRDDTTF